MTTEKEFWDTYEKDIVTCDCNKCRSACRRRVCWPLPSEASTLLDMGYADRMMLDYWVRDEGDILIVSPAMVGCEAGVASYDPIGACNFYSEERGCELHSICKPAGGRIWKACGLPYDHEAVSRAIAEQWDTDEGRAVVKRWMKLTNNNEETIALPEPSFLDILNLMGRFWR